MSCVPKPTRKKKKNYSTSFSTSEGLMSGSPLNRPLFFFIPICPFVEKVNAELVLCALKKLLIFYVGHYFPSASL